MICIYRILSNGSPDLRYSLNCVAKRLRQDWNSLDGQKRLAVTSLLCGLDGGNNVGIERLGDRSGLGSGGEVLGLDSGLSNGRSEALQGLGLGRLGNDFVLDRADKLGSLRGGRAAGADVSLGLGAVLADILLHQTGSLRSALTSQVAKLVGLVVDDFLGVDNLLVDEFTVADVDEGSEVGGGHGNNGQAPEGNEADQPVASEGSSESLEILLVSTRS